MPGRDLLCFNMCGKLPPKLFTHICNWVVSRNFHRPAMRAYITHEFHHWALGPGRRRPHFLQALSLLIKPSKQRQRQHQQAGTNTADPRPFEVHERCRYLCGQATNIGIGRRHIFVIFDHWDATHTHTHTH